MCHFRCRNTCSKFVNELTTAVTLPEIGNVAAFGVTLNPGAPLFIAPPKGLSTATKLLNVSIKLLSVASCAVCSSCFVAVAAPVASGTTDKLTGTAAALNSASVKASVC
jgi:hypothetical protein